MVDSFFELGKSLQLEVRDGPGIQSKIRPLIANYFGEPFQCKAGANCRSWLKAKRQHAPAVVSWQEEESLSTPLTARTISSLGAVANSTLFISKPSLDQLSLVKRPRLFHGSSFSDVQKECKAFSDEKYTFVPIISNAGSDERAELIQYCQTILIIFMEYRTVRTNQMDITLWAVIRSFTLGLG